ncbi:MAG: single-stranded-DNA-specific exonuclease RecJ [Candidatus Kerfeldbacteria bacterium]|nr:single-stranded-DNA-specific exonuclease RecJ [Candidatus Kerfeldbacteria bacterium]
MNEHYQWKMAEPAAPELLARFPELHPTVVQLLANRDMTTQEQVDRFLLPDYGQDQHDPYLFRDMHKAVARIEQAIRRHEKIVIHGDYDADGVCGSAVLYKTLQALGAEVDVYLPHRDTEGYGLNMHTVQSLHDIGTNLIITVDCGISNAPEIDEAVQLGMQVIVTDHHSQPPVLPERACAVLNPKLVEETYPFKYLAGVGVSFKLSQALIRKHNLGEAFEKWMLDMVAISTITDFVSLTGENRVFVKYGLVVLRRNQRLGLRELFTVMGVEPQTATTETIAFKIGPHINAAGRVKHANMAFDMLVEEDAQRAAEMAENLGKTNRERQQISERISKIAMVQAEQQQNESVIVVEANECPVGLVGLVAGKIASAFYRPTFVITNMGGEIVGSGRSIEQFNLVDALQSMDELFRKYGGHPMACGFSLKNPEALEAFRQRMRARATEQLKDVDLRKSVHIECTLALPAVDWTLIETLEQFAPFGEGNPEPVFASMDLVIDDISAIGKKGDHLRLKISHNGTRRSCIGFGLGEYAEQLKSGDHVDIVYTVGVNEWNGNREIQLVLKDLRKS